MSVKRKSAIVFGAFLFALFFVLSLSARADEKAQCTLYPDGRGGFVIAGEDHHSVTLMDINGKKSETQEVHFYIEGVISNNNASYAMEYADELLRLQELGSKMNFLMAGCETPKAGCVAINDSGDIFIVPENCDDLVYKITPDGQTEKLMLTGESIDLLFFHNSSGRVFALTQSGVADIENNRFAACTCPVLPAKLNNNICADADGNVFAFSEDTGFTKIADFKDFREICCTEDAVFLLNGNTVIKSDMNGSILGEYSPKDDVIDNIAASGNCIAVVCGGEVRMLKETQFRLPQEEEPSHETAGEPSEETSGKAQDSREESKSVSRANSRRESSKTSAVSRAQESSARSQASRAEASKENISRYPEIILESSIYTIDDNIISGIPYDTTIAVLKRNLTSDGELRFFTYKGKELKSGRLGTGAAVEVTINGAAHEYRIVVSGDVTGEGSCNTNDVRRIIKMSTGEVSPDRYQLMAADVNHDGEFDVRDVCMLCNEYYKNECQSGNAAFI